MIESLQSHVLVPLAPQIVDLPLSDSQVPSPCKELPEVSVIVPVYNDAVYIDSCLRSVLQQGFDSWECIVVDDASMDDTLARALHYVALDSRFRVVRHDRNLGASVARNTGIAHARGRFITLLDGDDFLFQDALLARWQMLADMNDHQIAGSWCYWQMVSPMTAIDEVPLATGRSGVLDQASGKGDNQVIATSPILRTSVVRSLGGFDSSFRKTEDFEFWTRLFRNGFKLVGTGTVGVAYRQKHEPLFEADPFGAARNVMQIWDYLSHSMESAAVCAGAPGPFVDPMPDLPDPSSRDRRMIVWLTLAWLTGDQHQIEGMLQFVPPGVLDDVQAVQTAINSALDRYQYRAGSLSVQETDRIRGEIMALIATASPVPYVVPHRHTGEIDLSRTAPVSAAARRLEDGACRRELIALKPPATARKNTRWDLVLQAATPGGYGDLLTLGRELVEANRSVAVVLPDSDTGARQRARFEGIQVVAADTGAARLALTSSPAVTGIDATAHLVVCTEPWLTPGQRGGHPDMTVVRGDWEARCWPDLPRLQVGSWLSRVSSVEQLCRSFDKKANRQRTETVLVLRAPGSKTGPGRAAISRHYGERFDFVFGAGLGARPGQLVTTDRIPVVMSLARAVVVIGRAVPVDALISGTPVVMIRKSSTTRTLAETLPGVRTASLEQLGDVLAAVAPELPPVLSEPMPPTDCLAHYVAMATEMLDEQAASSPVSRLASGPQQG